MTPRIASLLLAYLRNCLGNAVVRNHARQILFSRAAPMITDKRTKHPRTVDELAKATKFNRYVVTGCLVRLGEKGLVRCVDAGGQLWEVSHDFVARLLGQMLAGWRETFGRRMRRLVMPVTLVVWAATFIVAVPIIAAQRRAGQVVARHKEEHSLRAMLATKGFAVDDLTSERIRIRAYKIASIQTIPEELASLSRFARISEVDLSGCIGLTTIEPLRELHSLTTLNLSGCYNLTTVEPLRGLHSLATLDLNGCKRLTTVEPLGGLRSLTSLSLSHCDALPFDEVLKFEKEHPKVLVTPF